MGLDFPLLSKPYQLMLTLRFYFDNLFLQLCKPTSMTEDIWFFFFDSMRLLVSMIIRVDTVCRYLRKDLWNFLQLINVNCGCVSVLS